MVWYFFSIIGGALIALAAEIVALIPNTKLTRMMKRNGLGSAQKLEAKAIKKELKKKNRAYAVSFIIASIALVLVIFYIASIESLSTLN